MDQEGWLKVDGFVSVASPRQSEAGTPQALSLGEDSSPAQKFPQPPRPFSYWLARHPPGWLSQHSAATADPIALATKVHELTVAFVDWLSLPRNERWDTFTLQALSAALFNRYRVAIKRRPKRLPPSEVGLLQLNWPLGSEAIQRNVAELQQLLVQPFAVYKAVRIAADAEDFPTPQELRLAEEAVVAAREKITSAARQLGHALQEYVSPPAHILDA